LTEEHDSLGIASKGIWSLLAIYTANQSFW
jgi:hypothetical protein